MCSGQQQQQHYTYKFLFSLDTRVCPVALSHSRPEVWSSTLVTLRMLLQAYHHTTALHT